MARSTQTQKAQRLNAAYRLLSHGTDTSAAATQLVREHGISIRHAYRYLAEAAQLKQPVTVTEPAFPMTFKIPVGVILALRAYATEHGLKLSHLVTCAITEYLARARKHG